MVIFKDELNGSRPTRRFYGSLKAMFDAEGDRLGKISKHTLYRWKDEDWTERDFENEKVIVCRGQLIGTGDIKKTDHG